jgi:hypothetical protein
MSRPEFPEQIPNNSQKLNVEEFLNSKEHEFQNKMRRRHQFQLNTSWVIIGLLMITLVGLGGLSLREIQRGNQTIEELNERQGTVAGINNLQPFEEEPITGFGFTILPDQPIPAEFTQSREVLNSPFFENREQVSSSFKVTISEDDQQLESGITVAVLEYDNKLNHAEFSTVVQETLGERFVIDPNQLILPGEFKLQMISSDLPSPIYYTALTTDNYYIITHHKDLAGRDDYQEISTTTEQLLEWLYLN